MNEHKLYIDIERIVLNWRAYSCDNEFTSDIFHSAKNHFEELEADNREKDARISELEAAIDGVLAVVDASKMVPKLNLRGAGGQTIAANIRASDYLRVDAWPFEKLRDARAALGESDGNN